jgi:hypothetical protein
LYGFTPVQERASWRPFVDMRRWGTPWPCPLTRCHLDAHQAAIGEGTEGGAGALVDHAQFLDPLPQGTAVAPQDRDWLGVLEPPQRKAAEVLKTAR